MHLCTELIAASLMLERFGVVGAIFSYNFPTQFAKCKNKVITENQCENHKIQFSMK